MTDPGPGLSARAVPHRPTQAIGGAVEDPTEDPGPGAGDVPELDLAAELADSLVRGGYLTAAWADAWRAVDREAFLPDRVWVPGPDGYRRLDRADDPDRWRALAHTDIHLAIQVAEGPEAVFSLHPTSSASMPRMVAGMLAHLDVRDGQRVLEIGTGAGITAALLAERLGGDAVVSVELDAEIAAQAERSLHDAGYCPRLVVGDGTRGVARCAPYDRVISTCAVRTVPAEWVAQTRPGGRIVTPFGTSFHNGVLLALDVSGPGRGADRGAGAATAGRTARRTASGRVVGDAAFVWERGQGLLPGVMAAVRDEDEGRAVNRTVSWNPRALLDDPDAAFVVGVLVPGMRRAVGYPEPPVVDDVFTLWLVDAETESWACADHVPGRKEYDAAAYGPRDLLAETGRALEWWASAGHPARTRFGIDVGIDVGRVADIDAADARGGSAAQVVWLDDPGCPVGPLGY